jgi:rubrerythrin
MGGILSTKDNLGVAISVVNHEYTEMYPVFIEQAESENNKRARVTFSYANEVEKIHHGLYQKALEAIEAGQQLKDEPFFVCQVCGNTVAGEAPDKCPVCGAPRSRFNLVE